MIPRVSKDRAVLYHRGDFQKDTLISMKLGSGRLSDLHDEILLRERETHLSIGTSLKVWALLLGWTSCLLSGLVLMQVTLCVLVLPHRLWRQFAPVFQKVGADISLWFAFHSVLSSVLIWKVLEIYVGLLTSVLLETVNLKTGFEGTSPILKIQLFRVEWQSFILSF